MAKFRIIRFNRIGVGLPIRNFISAKVIPKMSIGIKTITVIPFGFRSFIHQLLDRILGAFPNDRPTQQAPGFAIYQRKDIDAVFLSPMKVNNSSISASFTSFGIGALGKASA